MLPNKPSDITSVDGKNLPGETVAEWTNVPVAGEIVSTGSLGGADVAPVATAKPPAVKPSPDWAPTGPNGEKANIRLAHIPKDSPLRAIHGERYPAVAYVRGDEVQYDLPTGKDGASDVELQTKGFYSAFAERICRLCPHFVMIVQSKETP